MLAFYELTRLFCCRARRDVSRAPRQFWPAVGGKFGRPRQQARDRVDQDSVPDPSHGCDHQLAIENLGGFLSLK